VSCSAAACPPLRLRGHPQAAVQTAEGANLLLLVVVVVGVVVGVVVLLLPLVLVVRLRTS
jgi:heme/copper-type cytochrome/quinol oxidase subunit 2